MRPPPPKYPVVLSLIAAVLTGCLKATGYVLTDSIGLLSDAVESVVNLIAAGVALLSLWYAAQPVDDSHTYGHEKIEYFSSGLEGMLILTAAVAIAWYSITRLFNPEPLESLSTGMFLALLATAINLGVALILLRTAKTSESIILEADGQHLLSDVWGSVAVLIGLCLVTVTGITRLDSIIAILFSIWMCRTGVRLVKRSFHGLMDHALPVDEQAKVRSAIAAQLEPGTTFHALRTRRSGAHRFADFHLLVPGRLSVQSAHDLTEKIEQAIRDALPSIEVTVHIEPIEEKAAWQDSPLLPIEQARRGSTTEGL